MELDIATLSIHILDRRSFVKFNMVGISKIVATTAVGLGVNKIVSQVLKNHVTAETLVEKITITAATWVITGMAVKASEKYVDEQIDAVVAGGTKIIAKFKLEAKLTRITLKESTFEKEGLNEDDFEQDKSGAWRPKKVVEGETATVTEPVQN